MGGDSSGALPLAGEKWSVRLLGRLDVLTPSGERAKFRSKSASALVALLTLKAGSEVSRFLLQESLWPESDSDKQAQNLRRAVADARDALEEGLERGTVVITRRDVVALNLERIESDVASFMDLTERGLQSNAQELLEEAIDHYGGPLLPTLTDDWVYAYRLELEERFAQAVEAVCTRKCAAGMAKEAVRLGRSALVMAPTREETHVALIRAYRAAGLEAEALRQFEDLEKMLDENWGEPPSRAAFAALEGEHTQTIPSVPSTPVRQTPRVADLEPAGGAVPLGSRYYVRRAADDEVEAAISRQESVVLIQGPRQVGKSSLLARGLAFAREQGCKVAFSDFQTIGSTQLADEETFYRTLAHAIAKGLGVELDLGAAWNSWLGPNMNLDSIMNSVLEKADGNVCWGVDEADRLFERSYTDDFFGLLRSWHNRRAFEPEGPWGKLTMVLTYATEAHLFITDLNQSPFNVGVRLGLRDFSAEEVVSLALCYGIEDGAIASAAHAVTQGHPFLARRALAFFSQGGTLAELECSASSEDGPFGDHLARLLTTLTQDERMLGEVRNLLAGASFADPRSRHRLVAAGVIRPTTSGTPAMRVPAYDAYLRRLLV